MRDPTTSRLSDLIVQRRITNVMVSFRGIVEGMSIDAGISHLPGFQIYRLKLAVRHSRTTLAPPLFWMKRFLSRKALRFDMKYRPMNSEVPSSEVPSFAWMFVGIVVLSETIEQFAGLNFEDIQKFTVWICHEFFNETAMLLKKMRNAKMDSVEEDWAALNENLTAIYLLTMYCSVRKKLQYRFLRSVTNQRLDAMMQDTQERLTVPTGGAIEDLISSEDGIYFMGGNRDRMRFLKLHKAVIKEEAWNNLRDYTQHWLDKLGEGPGCFGRVMVSTFYLNTLCRLESGPGSLAPPAVNSQSIQSVFEQAFTLYHTLEPEPKERQQARMRHLANFIPSAFRNADDISLPAELDFIEELIASAGAEKGPSEGKDRKIKAPEDFPEDSLGFLEPLVASDEGRHQRPFFKVIILRSV